MEMNERETVTLVEFNPEDSMKMRNLKELIIDMTRKDPRKRISIDEVCVRLNGEYKKMFCHFVCRNLLFSNSKCG